MNPSRRASLKKQFPRLLSRFEVTAMLCAWMGVGTSTVCSLTVRRLSSVHRMHNHSKSLPVVYNPPIESFCEHILPGVSYKDTSYRTVLYMAKSTHT